RFTLHLSAVFGMAVGAVSRFAHALRALFARPGRCAATRRTLLEVGSCGVGNAVMADLGGAVWLGVR
ncbi:hypothetical protein AB0I35_25490, partial [Nocardia sp. NPDC050378]|uniref:hypothetical protein n=1 Tax=Nocardia sp. NPDC050378 TaxID=3155400 RepID=UPI0033E111AE